MLQGIIWLLALLCPNGTHTITHHGTCQMVHLSSTSTEEGDDTGGETSNPFPKPPVPPPPPPPGS